MRGGCGVHRITVSKIIVMMNLVRVRVKVRVRVRVRSLGPTPNHR